MIRGASERWCHWLLLSLHTSRAAIDNPVSNGFFRPLRHGRVGRRVILRDTSVLRPRHHGDQLWGSTRWAATPRSSPSFSDRLMFLSGPPTILKNCVVGCDCPCVCMVAFVWVGAKRSVVCSSRGQWVLKRVVCVFRCICASMKWSSSVQTLE